MSVVKVSPRPPVYRYVQWTGSNLDEILEVVNRTVVDNEDGTLTVSWMFGTLPVTISDWIHCDVTSPDSPVVSDSYLSESYSEVFGGTPFKYEVSGS
jgi:hypothetical protein